MDHSLAPSKLTHILHKTLLSSHRRGGCCRTVRSEETAYPGAAGNDNTSINGAILESEKRPVPR